VDGRGVPLGLAVAGANVPDFKRVQQTFDSMPVKRPEPTPECPQHLCLDAGYDCTEVKQWADKFGFTLHVRPRRPPAQPQKKSPFKKARRWVVERTHSFLHRFRRLLVRWKKREDTYLPMLHLALGIITWFHALVPS
jgi:putative transposase